MSRFKVGDRVRVYNQEHSALADVVEVKDVEPGLRLRMVGTPDAFATNWFYHSKQCRKLVKKERRRRRVWIDPTDVYRTYSSSPRKGWTPFVEVRRKK